MTTITTPECIVCGERTIITLNGSREERGFKDWQRGMLIQRALPHWNKDKAELLINGTHPDCWKTLMADNEVEDEEGHVVERPNYQENEEQLRDEHGRFVSKDK